MKTAKLLLLFSITMAFLAASPHADASGTYCVCPPKPPLKGAHAKVDRDKLDLGQKVFNGRTPAVSAEAAAQKPKLEALQARLPEKVARKKDLPSLAGKLSPAQLEALEYFVNQRYPMAK